MTPGVVVPNSQTDLVPALEGMRAGLVDERQQSGYLVQRTDAGGGLGQDVSIVGTGHREPSPWSCSISLIAFATAGLSSSSETSSALR